MVETLTRGDLGFRVVELSDYKNSNGSIGTNGHPPVAPEESKLESIAKDGALKAVRAVPIYLDRSEVINDAKKEETDPYAGYIRILKPKAQKEGNDIYFKLFDMTGQPGRYVVVFYEGQKNEKQTAFSRQEQKVQFNKLYTLPSDASFLNLKFPEYNSIPTKPAQRPEYAVRK